MFSSLLDLPLSVNKHATVSCFLKKTFLDSTYSSRFFSFLSSLSQENSQVPILQCSISLLESTPTVLAKVTSDFTWLSPMVNSLSSLYLPLPSYLAQLGAPPALRLFLHLASTAALFWFSFPLSG